MKFNQNRSMVSGDMERTRTCFGRNDGRTDGKTRNLDVSGPETDTSYKANLYIVFLKFIFKG